MDGMAELLSEKYTLENIVCKTPVAMLQRCCNRSEWYIPAENTVCEATTAYKLTIQLTGLIMSKRYKNTDVKMVW